MRATGRLPDLTGVQALVVRVKGDGRTYQLRLRTATGWRTPDYSAAFPTQPDQWQTHMLPLTTFVAWWRGRTLRDAPPLDPTQIRSVGVLLGDKNPGAFAVELDWIKATNAAPKASKAD